MANGVEVNKTRGNAAYDLLFLDGLRGIAAAVVMIGHVRWLLWEGFTEGYAKHPERYSLFEKGLVYFLSIFKFGHQSVLFFFVLSGFVIHLKYSKRLKLDNNHGFEVRDYFARRIKRIYPPFLFALLLTYVFDVWGSSRGFSIYFGRTPNDLINQNVGTDHSLTNLIGNLFFIRGGHVDIWGTNSPLWSLKYEWWFYVLYPFLLLVNRKTVSGSFMLVLALFASTFFIHFVPVQFFVNVFQYLLAWWLGVILADMYTKRIRITNLQLSFLALVLPVMVVVENRIHSDLVVDICWAIGFFGLLNLLFYLRSRNVQMRFLNKLKWLGDSSYTLYIVHFPLTVFMSGLVLHYHHNQLPKTQVFIFAAIVINVLIAWLLHFVIEKPFINRTKTAKSSLPEATFS